MMKRIRAALLLLVLPMLTACVTMPTGPSVMVLPGTGKSFEQFHGDDAFCMRWAEQRVGLSPQETANQSTASGAAAGTLIGAGLGAAIGAASGNPGLGAAIGAGVMMAKKLPDGQDKRDEGRGDDHGKTE